MAVVGKVCEGKREFHFEWKIDDFLSLSEEVGEFYDSPSFLFAGESWFLRIYPNGVIERFSRYISVYLGRSSYGPPIRLRLSFGLKTFDGKKEKEIRTTCNAEEIDKAYGISKLLKRSELSEKKSELVPSGVLTVYCTLECCEPSDDDEVDPATAECLYCDKVFLAKDVSSHKKMCLDKPIICPTCSGLLVLREWFDHDCQKAKLQSFVKLVVDFDFILKNKEHSDVTFKVKGEEFHLHKSILSGRSPYFQSMLTTETEEKTTRVIFIDDCEPNVFESFINFLYTGTTETLSTVNVCALYEVAEKYEDEQLRDECISFMKNSLSADNFCDFMTLALKHDDEVLVRSATYFFCRKTKEIISTAKWLHFVREYTTEANELHIKALDYNASKYVHNDLEVIDLL